MSVPKMVKNGQNSAFTTENRTALTQKTRKLKFKTVLKAQKGTKTSFLANFGTRQRAQERLNQTQSVNHQSGSGIPLLRTALLSSDREY
jgi:hypothetical protein